MTRLDKLDAEALYAELLAGVRGLLKPESVLVGIWSAARGLRNGCSKTSGWRARPA